MTEVAEQIALAKRHLYDHHESGCEQCAEARRVLRRTLGFVSYLAEESE